MSRYFVLICFLLNGCAALNITERSYVAPASSNSAKIRFLSNIHLMVNAHECGKDEREVKLARLYSGLASGLNINNNQDLNMPLKIDEPRIFKTEISIPANEPYGLTILGFAPPNFASLIVVGGVPYLERGSCKWNLSFTPKTGALYEVQMIAGKSENSSNIQCSKNLIEIVSTSTGNFSRKLISPTNEIEEISKTREITCSKK